jgi:hypothetical protein
MSALLIKLGVRVVVFGGVLGFAIWKNEKVRVQPKWAIPLVALVFALLNTGLYWVKPILNLATLGTLWFVLPFVLNGFFLYATDRLLRKVKVKVEIEGILTMAWLAFLLTCAHGALWLVLDKMIAV